MKGRRIIASSLRSCELLTAGEALLLSNVLVNGGPARKPELVLRSRRDAVKRILCRRYELELDVGASVSSGLLGRVVLIPWHGFQRQLPGMIEMPLPGNEIHLQPDSVGIFE
jgi:hypothetical protein